MTPLLQVRDLHVSFDTPQGTVRANAGVDLDVNEGETVGILGESGCGKTVLFLSILGLQQPGRIAAGSIHFDGQDITQLRERDLYRVRGHGIALVPQNHATALNPAYTIRDQLLEAMAVRERDGGVRTVFRRVDRLLDERHLDGMREVFGDLGFGDERMLARLMQSYPHELSGGMRQRVLIAMALLLEPRLLIADEPTTALDRATRAQSLELLRRLNERLTMLVVSHDLGAIAKMCSRVAVMYAGRIIEQGPSVEVLSRPRHPYSRALVAAQERRRGQPLPEVYADTSDLIHVPPGCPFHTACPDMMAECMESVPEMYSCGPVSVACHLYREATDA